MDYEKKYKEALERARQFSEKPYLEDSKGIVDYIFPELKESEGESIRKSLIDMLKNDEKCYLKEIAWLEEQGQHKKFRDSIQVGDKVTRNKDGVLVNLSQLNRVAKKDEKQGEQKSADKVEPKFKVGDFIVNDYCMGRIVEITNDAYLLDTEQGILFSCPNTRLWDITKDAKDGDVLINWNNTIFIFKAVEDETVKFHIAYNEKWDTVKTPSTKLSHLGLPEPQFEFHPATQEQRDTLMKAMIDAGYTFDFEKKELKKIEQNPAEEYNIAGIGSKNAQGKLGQMIKKLKPVNEVLEQKPWSEEEEKKQNYLIALLQNSTMNNPALRPVNEGLEEWLKSLRPHSQWKPSDEQMNTLEHYMHTLICNEHKEILFGLYADLKKLREE